jgi:hypothetical protein
LSGVSFTDANNGTVVGGIILRTTNGGTDWILQPSGTTEYLYAVSFIDANNETAVGSAGTILRTTNGGTDWTSQTSGTTYGLLGVSFPDANTGTAVGEHGTILRTINGGTDWTAQTSGTTRDLLGVSFTDPNNGTAVGDVGTILRTTDGGTTWTLQSSGTSNLLYGVSFTDANNGTVVGDVGTILRTTNGGGIPVELTSFTALTNGEEVILNWSTATELNNHGFEVERSEDNICFDKVGFIPGFGTTTEPKSYSFSDQSINNGTYYYRLKQIDFNGTHEYSGVVEVEFRSFNSYLLEQNYPNPFNPSTKIKYWIQQSSNVTIKVFDILGNEIETLVNEEKPVGTYEITWYAEDLPSGFYFYTINAENFVETKKMILMK